ncbi:MAG: type II toxin-antitoxin system RelE/ParE family toxin [Cytophagales bacterium]|nr:type II toxin-antitoxin system RelE/ParE family toxin [Cytophagales bacterium]
MDYKISLSTRAQEEIEKAIDYYSLYSNDAPKHFITSLTQAYATLEKNPFFSLRYKNIRALRLNRFPYLLYYVIDENQKTLRILSCFHAKRNPNKRPDK